MAVFTVHAPQGRLEPVSDPERVEFVKDGFSWGAFLFGPFWMLWNRLWIALAVWIVAVPSLLFLASLVGGGRGSLLVLTSLFLGLEGNAILANGLRWRGLALSGLTVGATRDEAERRFFAARPAPTPMLNPVRAAPQKGGFLGLFPESDV